MTQALPLIGAHVSAAGSLDTAIKRIADLKGNCVQIFSASPRVWARKEVAEEIVQSYLQKARDSGILQTVIHAIYLVNLASDKPEMMQKSMDALRYDLTMSSRLKATGVVVHLGSHQGRGYRVVRDQIIDSIKTLLSETPDDSFFLMENSAGQQGKIASKLEEIQDLLGAVNSPRLGWCVDTCHAHAAGYRLAVGHGSEYSEEPFLLDEITRLGLWESLKVVHVNDSRDEFFSGRDRHANLGEGQIGNDVLRLFVRDERIKALPLILEVPGEENLGPDRMNMEQLLRYFA